ncbi:uncharacterized protein LOC121731259 [Aricia agestis]|uniref:uncharacterized protein LOC121731259 n=1 Tax=Aricia agestis TaxID=91739 RepID=UPI001C202DDE|nr:uncharacterized protein LOC121731259 [Aricia agestis]
MDKLKSNPLKRGKRSDKPVQSKKMKCEGSACSTFFADLTKKFKMKKKAKEDTNNDANSTKENIAKTLPVEVPKTLEANTSVQENPTENNVQRDTNFSHVPDDDRLILKDDNIIPEPPGEVITKIDDSKPKNLTPIFENPEIVKNNGMQTDIHVKNIQTSSILVNNGPIEHVTAKMEPNTVGMKEQDIAGELTKHVATLRKISLIADEFNKKTAKNLKEIVASVSEDLVKKLEEVKAEQAQSPRPEKKVAINQNGITIN